MMVNKKRILLTGASSGIGYALAIQLAEAGAQITFVGRDQVKLDALVNHIRFQAGNKEEVCQLNSDDAHLKESKVGAAILHTICCDLAEPRAAEIVGCQAEKIMGGIDILINCAGVSDFSLLENQSPHLIEEIIHLNLTVPIQFTNVLLKGMKARNTGQIVNIGSIFGSIGFAYFSAYSASKFGLRGFSQSLRRELKETGISVTYVAPRFTKTPLNNGVINQMAKAVGMNSDDPDLVASYIVRAIENDSRDYYIGWPELLFVRVNAIFPKLLDVALRGQNKKMSNFAAISNE